MVNCTESRPGSVTTLMRAWAVAASRHKTPTERPSAGRKKLVSRRFIALHVEPIEIERHRGFLGAVGFRRQGEVVFKREGILLLELFFVRVFNHLPVTGEMLNDN